MDLKTTAGDLLPGDQLRTTTASGSTVKKVVWCFPGNEVVVEFCESWRIPLRASAGMAVAVRRQER